MQDVMTKDRPREVIRKTTYRPGAQLAVQNRAASPNVRISREDPVNRARSDVARFQRSGGPSRGRGAGRGVGARGGRGAARGRGDRTRDGPQRRKPGLGMDDEEDDEETDDWEEYTGMYQLLTSDDNIDAFASLNEAQSYARLQDFVNEYDEAVHLTEAVTEDALQAKQDPREEIIAAHNHALESWDGDVSEALQHLVNTDEKAYPRHEPSDFAVDAALGELGSVPVGQAGMGNIIEDGLRYVSNRELNDYQRARELADKLVAGEFVKFRNLPEKREVVRLAEGVAYSADTPEGQAHCGFESPSEEAKQLLVKRFVQGKYRDPQDASIKSEVLRNAARIAGGNASYHASSKQALLKTIRDLLPAERTGQAAQRAR